MAIDPFNRPPLKGETVEERLDFLKSCYDYPKADHKPQVAKTWRDCRYYTIEELMENAERVRKLGVRW